MDAVESFLNTIQSQHSRRAYRADLTDFVDHQSDDLGEFRLDEVTKEDVGDYLRFVSAQNLSTSTIRRRLSTLRRFYDWLVDRTRTEYNPARACQVDVSSLAKAEASDEDGRSSLLTRDQIVSLIEATSAAGAAATRDRALIITIVYAALRRAEVAAMDVEHVRPLGRHWIIDVPSTDDWDSEYVKIPETVVEAIDSVRDRHGIMEGPIWRSLSNRNRGSRLTPDAIYKIVRRTGRHAGIDGVTVERLRQSGLHLALIAGATENQVQMHARLQSLGSVQRYAERDVNRGRLSESAVDVLELDV